MELESNELRRLYATRFEAELSFRDDIWKILCAEYFQRWVPPDSAVLDVAAGHCEFINNIAGATRIAIDLNPDVQSHARPGVEAHVCRSDAMTPIADDSIDVVFVSNFFEHVSREVILSTLTEIRRVLRSQGRLLILQPNIRYCFRDYWRFFDHITPIDDRALCEALIASGFDVVKCVPRFLPYTTKSRLPAHPLLLRLYLRLPMAWRVLGAQAFVVGAPQLDDRRRGTSR